MGKLIILRYRKHSATLVQLWPVSYARNHRTTQPLTLPYCNDYRHQIVLSVIFVGMDYKRSIYSITCEEHVIRCKLNFLRVKYKDYLKPGMTTMILTIPTY